MPNSAKHVFLVDGASFLFRAYHAIRQNLTTSDGRTTHAVFGTINMLRSLVREYAPEHLAVVLDARGKTFRSDLYSAYKANRPPMPEDLRAQFGATKKIISAMGIPLLEVPGVEADDVIATLTEQACRDGFHTTIVSSDKDLAQLVRPEVEMLDTMRNVRLDVDGVRKKFGVLPTQMVDYLTLVGDSVDNVPGVPGVGPKTAVKWLNQYLTLEQIKAQRDEIGGRVGEALRENLAQLDLSRQLVTLKSDLELATSIHDLTPKPADPDALRAVYQDLEFRAWLKELDPEMPATAESSPTGTPAITSQAGAYQTILDPASLQDWIEKLRAADLFALDTETTSTDPHRAELVGISFATEPGCAAYLPLGHAYVGAPQQLPMASTLEALRPILEDPERAKTGQNLKYDLEVLHHHGIALRGIRYDTMLMSYLLDAGNSRHDLDTLALKHLGHTCIKFSSIAGSGKNQLSFAQVDLQRATNYAAEDADIALQLHHALLPRIEANQNLKKVLTEIEIPLIDALARTEIHGVKVDAQKLHQQGLQITENLQTIARDTYACAGEEFNIASPKQIQEILYHKQGIPVLRKTPKGQPSTAEDVLQELALQHDLPRLILEHRSLAKLKSTYIDKLPELIHPRSGRIHTNYQQAVAATGRLSSNDPNLQNIPIRSTEGRQIREAFVAEPGYCLVAADYSQIELRIMAHLSADSGLLDAFQRGLDVHRITASEVFGCAVKK